MQVIWKSSVIDCHYINHAWPVFARFASLLSCGRPFLHLQNLFSSRTLYKLFPFYFFFGQWKWLCYFLPECNRTSESHFANIFFDAEWCFINVAGKLHMPRWSYRENNSCGGVFLNLFFFYRDFNAPRKPCLGLIQAGWTLNIITSFQDYRSMSMIYLIPRDLCYICLTRKYFPDPTLPRISILLWLYVLILHSCLSINHLSRHTLLKIPKWKRSRWITVVGCLCRAQFLFFWVPSWIVPPTRSISIH